MVDDLADDLAGDLANDLAVDLADDLAVDLADELFNNELFNNGSTTWFLFGTTTQQQQLSIQRSLESMKSWLLLFFSGEAA